MWTQSGLSFLVLLIREKIVLCYALHRCVRFTMKHDSGMLKQVYQHPSDSFGLPFYTQSSDFFHLLLVEMSYFLTDDSSSATT